MPRAERQVTINAPIDKVFEYVTDFTRHPEWASQPLEIAEAPQGPLAVGSKVVTVGKLLGTHRDQVTVTELTPPSRLGYESSGDAGTWRHWFSLREQGGATVVSKGMESRKMSTSTKLALPIILLTLGGGVKKDLAKIKARVEGSAG